MTGNVFEEACIGEALLIIGSMGRMRDDGMACGSLHAVSTDTAMRRTAGMGVTYVNGVVDFGASMSCFQSLSLHSWRGRFFVDDATRSSIARGGPMQQSSRDSEKRKRCAQYRRAPSTYIRCYGMACNHLSPKLIMRRR